MPRAYASISRVSCLSQACQRAKHIHAQRMLEQQRRLHAANMFVCSASQRAVGNLHAGNIPLHIDSSAPDDGSGDVLLCSRFSIGPHRSVSTPREECFVGTLKNLKGRGEMHAPYVRCDRPHRHAMRAASWE
jgi:hypothetical protein